MSLIRPLRLIGALSLILTMVFACEGGASYGFNSVPSAHAQVVGEPNCTRLSIRTSPMNPPESSYGCRTLSYGQVFANSDYTVSTEGTHLVVESLIDDRKSIGWINLHDPNIQDKTFKRRQGSGMVIVLKCDNTDEFRADIADRARGADGYMFTMTPRGFAPRQGGLPLCGNVSTGTLPPVPLDSFQGPVIGQYQSQCEPWVTIFDNPPVHLKWGFDPNKLTLQSVGPCGEPEALSKIATLVRDGALYFDQSYFAMTKRIFLPSANR